MVAIRAKRRRTFIPSTYSTGYRNGTPVAGVVLRRRRLWWRHLGTRPHRSWRVTRVARRLHQLPARQRTRARHAVVGQDLDNALDETLHALALDLRGVFDERFE